MGSALVLLLRTDEYVKILICMFCSPGDRSHSQIRIPTAEMGFSPCDKIPTMGTGTSPWGRIPTEGTGISGCWSWDRVPMAQSPRFLKVAASGPFLRARKVWDSPGKNQSRNTVARQRM